MPSHITDVHTKLQGIAQRKTEKQMKQRGEKFTNLFHLLTPDFLADCFQSLRKDAAAGIDHQTWQEYEEEASTRIPTLAQKLQQMSYHPLPVRRVYIPKDEHTKRPLGIPAIEDKIVQEGLCRLLEAVFAGEFLDCSHGFRPQRGCKTALKALKGDLMARPVNYIIDADIRDFFGSLDHEGLMKCLEQWIGDVRLLRMIRRYLKAGVCEDGEIEMSECGVPQGGCLSPTLSNIYLHYALDVWFTDTLRKNLNGYASLVRYADDFVFCLQHEQDATHLMAALQARLARCGLVLAEEKTRIILFSRYAEDRAKRSCYPCGTFDFLGFTHIWCKTRSGALHVKLQTSMKKFRQKVKAMKCWLQSVRHKLKLPDLWQTLQRKIHGHYNYYGIRCNIIRLSQYYREVIKLIYRWLNKCSQRPRWTNRSKFRVYLQRYPLPLPRIVHDW